MKTVLSTVIHQDQSYCVMHRSMHDNFCWVRDLWDVCEIQQQYTGLFFIDQVKAFDSVHHEYFFYILKLFGFGPSLISFVTLLEL